MRGNEAIPPQQVTPVTVQSLTQDLSALGITPGMTLIVHSSLSALGWVCGGPVAVIQALESVIGTQGTLIMPTHTGDNSDPANWKHPPVPQTWWEPIRQTMPPFEPELSPPRGMGFIVETFRKQPGVLRSSHPQLSFAAWGRHAQHITANHALSYSLGEGSPLARIYDLDGRVLLLGVGYGNNTSLHLAEYRAAYPGKKIGNYSAAMLQNGERAWITFQDINQSSDDFVALGEAFARDTGLERRGRIGEGLALLMPQRAMVDYAVRWMESHRT